MTTRARRKRSSSSRSSALVIAILIGLPLFAAFKIFISRSSLVREAIEPITEPVRSTAADDVRAVLEEALVRRNELKKRFAVIWNDDRLKTLDLSEQELEGASSDALWVGGLLLGIELHRVVLLHHAGKPVLEGEPDKAAEALKEVWQLLREIEVRLDRLDAKLEDLRR